MTAEEMLGEILERLRRLEGERTVSALPKPEAARRMGIGLTKLRQLIRSGRIATCEGSSRLVPISEIERWTAPRKPKGPTRRVAPRGAKLPRGYDAKEEAERIRALARKKP